MSQNPDSFLDLDISRNDSHIYSLKLNEPWTEDTAYIYVDRSARFRLEPAKYEGGGTLDIDEQKKIEKTISSSLSQILAEANIALWLWKQDSITKPLNILDTQALSDIRGPGSWGIPDKDTLIEAGKRDASSHYSLQIAKFPSCKIVNDVEEAKEQGKILDIDRYVDWDTEHLFTRAGYELWKHAYEEQREFEGKDNTNVIRGIDRWNVPPSTDILDHPKNHDLSAIAEPSKSQAIRELNDAGQAYLKAIAENPNTYWEKRVSTNPNEYGKFLIEAWISKDDLLPVVDKDDKSVNKQYGANLTMPMRGMRWGEDGSLFFGFLETSEIYEYDAAGKLFRTKIGFANWSKQVRNAAKEAGYQKAEAKKAAQAAREALAKAIQASRAGQREDAAQAVQTARKQATFAVERASAAREQAIEAISAERKYAIEAKEATAAERKHATEVKEAAQKARTSAFNSDQIRQAEKIERRAEKIEKQAKKIEEQAKKIEEQAENARRSVIQATKEALNALDWAMQADQLAPYEQILTAQVAQIVQTALSTQDMIIAQGEVTKVARDAESIQIDAAKIPQFMQDALQWLAQIIPDVQKRAAQTKDIQDIQDALDAQTQTTQVQQFTGKVQLWAAKSTQVAQILQAIKSALDALAQTARFALNAQDSLAQVKSATSVKQAKWYIRLVQTQATQTQQFAQETQTWAMQVEQLVRDASMPVVLAQVVQAAQNYAEQAAQAAREAQIWSRRPFLVGLAAVLLGTGVAAALVKTGVAGAVLHYFLSPGKPKKKGPPNTPAGCQEGTVFCNNICVNTGSDNNNCGRCDNACSLGMVCSSGICLCSSGTSCNGICVNTSSDNSNCGGCGNTCSAGMICSNGTCVCSSTTPCNGVCVDTTSDPGNCGTCGNACSSGMICSSGTCVCSSGTPCNGACVDTSSDNNNCGNCGNVCSSGMACSSGACVCPPGQTSCGGGCIPSGTPCCGSGTTPCGGGCMSSGNTCCNTYSCPPGATCCNGGCIPSGVPCCAPGMTPCGTECMPSGATCCNNGTYCGSGLTCCGSICIQPGYTCCDTYACLPGFTCCNLGPIGCCP